MILNKKCREIIIEFKKMKTEIPKVQAEKSIISRISRLNLIKFNSHLIFNLIFLTLP